VWDDRLAVLDDDLMRAVLDQCHEKWSRTVMKRFDPECVVERELGHLPSSVFRHPKSAALGRAAEADACMRLRRTGRRLPHR
jgi:hypothetical protein